MKKKSIEEKYSDLVVQRVNELYHDLIGKKYDSSHPEIFKRLPKRWEKIADIHFKSEKPLTILDLGTGTGFVPLIVGRFLTKKDSFICSDISQNMLNVAREHLTTKQFSAQFSYVKVKPRTPLKLPFKDKSMDTITINSMLHHVKNTNQFLSEVDRVLKPKGKVIIAHEPHYYFNQDFFLKNQARIFQIFLCPRQTITRIARKIGLDSLLEKTYYLLTPPKVNNQRIAQEINKILLQEDLISEPIVSRDIKKITDIKIQGFRPEEILPEYSTILFETYNHLSDDIAKKYNNRVILKYEALLERIYPTKGNQLFIIKQKPHRQ